MGLLNADEEIDIAFKELVFFVNGKKVSCNLNDLITCIRFVKGLLRAAISPAFPGGWSGFLKSVTLRIQGILD